MSQERNEIIGSATKSLFNKNPLKSAPSNAKHTHSHSVLVQPFSSNTKYTTTPLLSHQTAKLNTLLLPSNVQQLNMQNNMTNPSDGSVKKISSHQYASPIQKKINFQQISSFCSSPSQQLQFTSPSNPIFSPNMQFSHFPSNVGTPSDRRTNQIGKQQYFFQSAQHSRQNSRTKLNWDALQNNSTAKQLTSVQKFQQLSQKMKPDFYGKIMSNSMMETNKIEKSQNEEEKNQGNQSGQQSHSDAAAKRNNQWQQLSSSNNVTTNHFFNNTSGSNQFFNNTNNNHFYSTFSSNISNMRRDSENDLFSTNRKEHRAIELLRTKLGQEDQLSGISIPKKSDKMLTCTSYLTSKLNPFYEKAMNLVSDNENKKFNFNLSPPSFYQPNPIKNRPLLSKKSLTDGNEDGYSYNYVQLKQGETVELIAKQRVTNLIHAEALEFFYVFINVKLMPTPVRIHFKAPLSKLKVFISKSSSFPSKFSNDETLQVKKQTGYFMKQERKNLLIIFFVFWDAVFLQSNVIKFEDGSNSRFQFEKLFFGVLSEVEQEIRVTVRFGSELPQPSSSSLKPNELPFSDLQKGQTSKKDKKTKARPVATPVLAQDVAEIKEKRRRRMMRFQKDGQEKNFQQENIDYISSFSPDTHKTQTLEKTEQFNTKLKDVYEKKQLLDEQHYFKKDYNQKYRSIQKQINYLLDLTTSKRRKNTLLSNNWATLILQVLTLQKFCEKIRQEVIMRRKLRSQDALMKDIVKKFRLGIDRNPCLGDVESRVRLECRQTLLFMCGQSKKKAKQRAAKVVIEILENRKDTYSFSNHLVTYLKTINFIIGRWRDFHIKKINFQRMLGFLFDKYFSKVIETISKASEDSDDFFSQITNARRINKQKTEQTREKFIELFFKRRRSEFAQDLYKYFALYHKDNQKKLLYMQMFLKKRQDEEFGFKKNQFDELNEDKEKQIESILFSQVLDKKRAESFAAPRFFVVPSYEVLKQVIYQTFVEIHDQELVKKLQRDKAIKNWTEAKFLKMLILSNEGFGQLPE